MSIYSHCNQNYCNPNMATLATSFDVFAVPDDVFAQNYIWKGSYNYKGRKQPMTLTVTSFNATSGRVNATLTNSNMELLLSGVYKSQEARLMLHIYLIKAPSHTLLNKLKEEKWAMDGFVSIVSAKYCLNSKRWLVHETWVM
uniref:CUB and sushi domain-containing protein 3 n=1 Tax=Sphaerodactylus townsendi TaxID=933632 RepID=A0ACB8FE32_9SAUR